MIFFFFFTGTATTEIYTLSLPDALPISSRRRIPCRSVSHARIEWTKASRSEEHTSELQSRENIVCRRLLEKKKKKQHTLSVTIKNKRIRSQHTLATME